MPFQIIYTHAAEQDIAWVPRNEQVLLRAMVERILADEPDSPSNKRKRLEANPFDADWELRQGDLRAFYTVDREQMQVQVVRSGRKRGNALYVRGELIDLRAQL